MVSCSKMLLLEKISNFFLSILEMPPTLQGLILNLCRVGGIQGYHSNIVRGAGGILRYQ